MGLWDGRAREGELGGEDNLVFHADGSLGLNKWAEATEEARFDQEDVTGAGGAEDFHGLEGGEFEVGQRGEIGIALGGDAGELGDGFGKEDSRKKWGPREMAGDE